MSDAPAFDPLPAGALRMQLPSLASIDAEGADAREFLHGQLSSDVKALAVGDAHYASYNSPKGRMLATPIVWRRANERYALVLAADSSLVVVRGRYNGSPSPAGWTLAGRRRWRVAADDRRAARGGRIPLAMVRDLRHARADRAPLPNGA